MRGVMHPAGASHRGDAAARLHAAGAPAGEATPFSGLAGLIGEAADVPLVERARALYAARRRRDALLGAAVRFFHDPAWDIMLDLFIRSEDHQIVSISSACVGACVAHTTALRHLKAMERKGVINFRHDPFDRRRRFVALSADTHRRMVDWLAAM